jgi:hypothetical protein
MIRELCFTVPHSTPAVNTPERRAALFIGSSRSAHLMYFLIVLLPCGQAGDQSWQECEAQKLRDNLSFYNAMSTT